MNKLLRASVIVLLSASLLASCGGGGGGGGGTPMPQADKDAVRATAVAAYQTLGAGSAYPFAALRLASPTGSVVHQNAPAFKSVVSRAAGAGTLTLEPSLNLYSGHGVVGNVITMSYYSDAAGTQPAGTVTITLPANITNPADPTSYVAYPAVITMAVNITGGNLPCTGSGQITFTGGTGANTMTGTLTLTRTNVVFTLNLALSDQLNVTGSVTITENGSTLQMTNVQGNALGTLTGDVSVSPNGWTGTGTLNLLTGVMTANLNTGTGTSTVTSDSSGNLNITYADGAQETVNNPLTSGGTGGGTTGGGGGTSTGLWTWVSGASTTNQLGNYGTKGTAAATNIPGARYGAVTWTDKNGNFWLFGGYGYDSTGALGELNDLWKFDGTVWTWMSGANAAGQAGTYGTKGAAAASNMPGARDSAVSWIDSSGNLWLFGGLNSAAPLSVLNDLWKFDGTNWTWVSGSKFPVQSGNYGTKGTPATTNVPGARYSPVSWIDASNKLWLFGGYGYDTSTLYGALNDLWKFDGTNWTWVSGATTTNQAGNYGNKGTAAATNVPGARESAVSWIDSSGNLWLFGGSPGGGGGLAIHNDLWKFDGTIWTWVSGANTGAQPGVYGTRGASAATNIPGARYGAGSWIDKSNNLWLFGGGGYDTSTGVIGELNDLWKFDGTNWTWVSGANTKNQAGAYGAKGTAAATNMPGGRAAAATWIDKNGNLWIFGGYDENFAFYNDLWMYQP